MRRILLYLCLLGVLFGLPILSYGFLDQLYSRRFEDFTYKLLLREVKSFSKGKHLKSLKKYEAIAQASTDLKGFALLSSGSLVEKYGDAPDRLEIEYLEPGSVLIERVGFLKYRTYIAIPDKVPTDFIVFTLQDDTAMMDFMILVFAAIAVVFVVLIAMYSRELEKIQTIRDTTKLTVRSLAHDFRAPFSKLRNFMALIESPEQQISPRHRLLRDDMLRSFQHVDNLLSDFLDLDHRTPIQSFHVRSVLKQIQDLYVRPWEEEFNIRFTMHCDEDLWARGNEKKSLRILFNFLDNAFQHAASWVHVEVSTRESELILSIANDGTPIEAGRLSQIFKPLQSYRSGGLGLGLFICESFARAQGGRVWCSSHQTRTEFFLALPAGVKATSVKFAEEADVQVQTTPSNTYNIAYIDDEAFYQQVLSESLAGGAHTLRVFTSTDEFLLVLRSKSFSPDLVVVDRFGPDFDAVGDRFPDSCQDYGYAGPIVLYSNSVLKNQNCPGFFQVLDKIEPLSSRDCIQLIERFKTGES